MFDALRDEGFNGLKVLSGKGRGSRIEEKHDAQDGVNVPVMYLGKVPPR